MIYDVVVVGGGPSGLTAALYAARAGRSVLVLEKESFGGQIVYSPLVDNYPACPHISGADLASQLTAQVMECGAECMSAEVLGVLHGMGQGFTVQTDVGAFEGKSVILATGVRHRKLGLPNEEDLVGRGVSYCAVCDGAFFAGQRVAVIGGGDTALKAALFLADRCSEVVIVHRRQELRAEQTLVEQAKQRSNVRFILERQVGGFDENEEGLTSLELLDSEGRSEVLAVRGAFVSVGQEPQSEPFALLGITDDRGYFTAGEDCRTEIDGLFVAGDCRVKQVRQLTTAVGDGAVAGLAAVEFTK